MTRFFFRKLEVSLDVAMIAASIYGESGVRRKHKMNRSLAVQDLNIAGRRAGVYFDFCMCILNAHISTHVFEVHVRRSRAQREWTGERCGSQLAGIHLKISV